MNQIQSEDRLKKTLKKIEGLDSREEKRVREELKKDLSGGLTREEIKARTRELSRKAGDRIEPSEAKRVREKLLEE